MVDLRSDTVTKPTKEMLEEMFKAKVGDDVFNEDPTIIKLEQMAANMFGMQAALFCPSGTMTNQIAINVHCKPGHEVICDKLSHIYNYEGGGIAKNTGASVRLLNGDRGRFTANDVLDNINKDDIHLPLTRMVGVENTSNRGGGCYWDFKELQKIGKVCKQKGLAYHMDGARLFNALVETGDSPQQYGKLFDSISICLSKGLGAPVGSLLLGNLEFIKQARRVRKVFGGGIRQGGYLAAAGIYALTNNINRLKEDHIRANKLAQCVKNLPYVKELLPVDTNIVVFTLKDELKQEDFIEKMKKQGILVVAFGKQTIRLTLHLDISDEKLNKTIEALKKIG